jgi:uncharacterized membrane protein
MRALRHLFATRVGTRRRFPDEVLASIEKTIESIETRTSGEIRFVIETALDLADLFAGTTPRARATQVFSLLQAWDTQRRNGVLIYVLVADHDVEIVADRGAAAVIPPEQWEAACKQMEEQFRAGRFAEGALAGVNAVGALLESHFPFESHEARSRDRDELPNQPTLL